MATISRLPTFLIIGAPRAGTTWLAANLRRHPEIFLPTTKELHYFNRHFHLGPAYYEAFFRDAAGFKAVGEATPEYLYLPEVPERIHALLPECKLILSLRNPVERVYSRYWNAKAKFVSNRNLSFEEKLASKPLFIEEGMYFTHLTRYYRYFSPDQFLVLRYEDIEARPHDVLAQCFEFLGVGSDFDCAGLEDRINSAADKPRLAKSAALYYVQRSAARLGLRKLARRVSDFNAAVLPPMDPQTRSWLANEVYGDENRRLHELTGIDVSGWT